MKRTLYQFLLAMLLLTGCNDPKPVTDALTRAEALMNEYPDSAWAVLNTLSPDEMGQNRTRAHYALLYTQAQDKTYRDETNDSLISIAVDYYRHTDDARRKFLSYYYKGRVYTNAKDYLNATSCYMEAEQLADAVGDDYLTGLLYAELGRIYRLYYDYPKSLEAHQKAAECYERAGKTRHRNYMWYNLSIVYRNINKFDESERMIRMALASAKEDGDQTLISYCMGALMMSFVEQNRMSEAKPFYEELKLLVDEDYGSPSFLGKLAQLHASEGDFVQAQKCLEQGWSRATDKTDSVSLYIASASLHQMQGDNAFAYQELQKGVTMQNGEMRQALQQPVMTVQRDYLSEKLEFEAYRLRMEKRLNLLYILFSVFILATVVYGFIKILKKNKKAAQQAISKLEQKRKETEKKKEQAEKDKEKLEEENRKISSLLRKMDRDKEMADQTIKDLKNEISMKEKKNNSDISRLLQKLKMSKEESRGAIANLKQELMQKEKDNDVLFSLLDELESEKNEAFQTIQNLNRTMEEKEESRQNMMALVQKLEEENKVNVETIASLRNSLGYKETVYRQYEQETEKIQKDLQSTIDVKSEHISVLLKDRLEFMGDWILLYEEQLTLKNYKEKKIKRTVDETRTKYFKGKDAFQNLERLVNLYHDNAMQYFREEIQLTDEKDYFRVCCLFAGIPSHVIAWMMDEKTDVVYQRKSRLRKKIASIPCLHQGLFLRMLPK